MEKLEEKESASITAQLDTLKIKNKINVFLVILHANIALSQMTLKPV